jgi:hypothetical protein
MKVEKLAAIAEIISSVAIVITLAYLAVQTQQTNSALVASSRQATMTADVAMVSAIIGNPEAFTNSSTPFSELTLVEQEQVGNVMAGLLRVREFAWFQYQSGILDESTLQSYLAPVARWIKRGDVMVVWELFSQELDQEFVDYVNNLLEETPSGVYE